MERQLRPVLAAAGFAAALSITSAQAATYTDAAGDLGANIGAWPHLDITAVEVNNTASALSFKIDLAGNPTTTDWGKYTIGFITGTGGDPTGDGWSRPIGMSFAGLGMNYWVGSWTDSGNGAQVWKYSGSAWGLQSASYNPNPDNISISKDSSSVTLQFNFSGLGLELGDTFFFDVYTTGGGSSDSAVDALANPLPTIANWSDPYNSGFRVQSYTLVPEPSVFALLGVGALAFIGRARRR